MSFRIVYETEDSGVQVVISDNSNQSLKIIRPEIAADFDYDAILENDEIWYIVEYATEPIYESNSTGALFLNLFVQDPYQAAVKHEFLEMLIRDYLDYIKFPQYFIYSPANIFTEKYFAPESNFELSTISLNPERFLVKTKVPNIVFEIVNIDKEPSFDVSSIQERIIFRVKTHRWEDEPTRNFYFLLKDQGIFNIAELEELTPDIFVLFFLYEKYQRVPFDIEPGNNFTRAMFLAEPPFSPGLE